MWQMGLSRWDARQQKEPSQRGSIHEACARDRSGRFHWQPSSRGASYVTGGRFVRFSVHLEAGRGWSKTHQSRYSGRLSASMVTSRCRTSSACRARSAAAYPPRGPDRHPYSYEKTPTAYVQTNIVGSERVNAARSRATASSAQFTRLTASATAQLESALSRPTRCRPQSPYSASKMWTTRLRAALPTFGWIARVATVRAFNVFAASAIHARSDTDDRRAVSWRRRRENRQSGRDARFHVRRRYVKGFWRSATLPPRRPRAEFGTGREHSIR